MKNYRFLLLLLLAASWLGACRKEDVPPITPAPIDYTVLPPATQIGANTFGCKVNGEVWVPRNETYIGYGNGTYCNFSEYQEGGGGISAQLVTESSKDILSLSFSPNLFNLSTHIPTNDSVIPYRVWLWFSKNGSSNYFIPDYENPASADYFTITHLDTSNNIISGQFNFTLSNEAGYTLNLTEGRFDMIYYPQ